MLQEGTDTRIGKITYPSVRPPGSTSPADEPDR
jgi:hypothetical protein